MDVGRRRLLPDFGLEGDAHGGYMHRQVSLLAEESIDKMRARGLELDHGAFGENLISRGIELVSLPIGTVLRVGEDVLLRVTQIGKECHDHCAIYEQVGDCIMPREGIFAEVLEGGEVQTDDPIVVTDGQAGTAGEESL
ncbi:MAG: MOSC domain-containing protein [Candidatus Eisenbacteria sp.]|nr:MOSC domain-containing protein [Candidatus Eisenbacteria bacterium]